MRMMMRMTRMMRRMRMMMMIAWRAYCKSMPIVPILMQAHTDL